jgi:metallo-beta-lactamase family protein
MLIGTSIRTRIKNKNTKRINMTIHLTSFGATEEVTGSMHLINIGNIEKDDSLKILLDCGAFQGLASEERNSWLPPSINPMQIKYIFLTHGHYDHIGRLPVLVNRGFRGKIICTPVTRDISFIVLDDMLKVRMGKQAEKEKDKNGISTIGDGSVSDDEKDKDLGVLFSEKDIAMAKSLFAPIGTNYGKWTSDDGSLVVSFLNSEHIIGSASILIEKPISLLYTGDLGGNRSSLHGVPSPIDVNCNDASKKGIVDYLIIESTYGDRIIEKSDALALQKAVEDIKESGGRLLIPVLAVDRAEEILYLLKDMGIEEKVYLDTPMGMEVLDVYLHNRYELTKIAKRFETHGEYQDSIHYLGGGLSQKPGKGVVDFKVIFKPKGFEKVMSNNKSQELANSKSSCIILASSGMLEGGRIMRYLPNILEDNRNILLFTSYQGEGTLGRQLMDGEKEVHIKYRTMRKGIVDNSSNSSNAGANTEGNNSTTIIEDVVKKVNVKCSIRRIEGVSAHADKNDLLEYINKLKILPKKVFVVHGERSSSYALKDEIEKRFRVETIVPKFNVSYELVESSTKENIVTKDMTNVDVLKNAGLLKFENIAGKLISPFAGWVVDNEKGFTLMSQDDIQKILRTNLEVRVEDKLYDEAVKKAKEFEESEISDTEIDDVVIVQKFIDTLIDLFDKKLISKGLIKQLITAIGKGRSEYTKIVSKRIENKGLVLEDIDLQSVGLPPLSEKQRTDTTLILEELLRKSTGMKIRVLKESLDKVYENIKDKK